MTFQVYQLVSQTILHCGAGQSVGIVDQPIARDRASNLPIVPGSSIRGVLRAEMAQQQDKNLSATTLFGSESSAEKGNAGALSVSDAHLLLLPVRSIYGVLAYATCPFILKRYKRDLQLKELSVPVPDPDQVLYAKAGSPNEHNSQILLEDLDLQAKHCATTQAWAEHIAASVYEESKHNDSDYQDMMQRIIILPDTIFSFLADTATEIRTRIRINADTGVVDSERGALWSEESLPAESILWGVYSFNDSLLKEQKAQIKSAFEKYSTQAPLPLLQVGGHSSVGGGLVTFSTVKRGA
ncbi:type III-B CRISPR module RAMP protein Cmr4 [Vibrio spartinae]|uniref:RAMP superfamily protein n=1 Tax=Vibrio spartinae TaxID=1918945 RepID=A0A1N6MAT8_9VIBR|nr:type III-B CRISPR module RAMP protein Cmr4 [Vibrio spartinae]SIO96523.1 RAMP superfamily protein [Vibrio spartinae]